MADTGNVLETLTTYTNDELVRMLKKLIFYAEVRLNKFGFVSRTEMDSVTGEDFAQEALARAIQGKRTWNKKEHPDLEEFLRMVIFSLIRNHVRDSARSPVGLKDLNDTDLSDSDDVEAGFINHATPDEVLISGEQWHGIEVAFGDDMDGFIFFMDWLDDIPPREIADKYGQDVTVIYRKIKKGKGIIKTVFAS